MGEDNKKRILEPFMKVQEWIENTKLAMAPHFDEVHNSIFSQVRALEMIKEQKSTEEKSEA